jgi:hypothetical protein
MGLRKEKMDYEFMNKIEADNIIKNILNTNPTHPSKLLRGKSDLLEFMKETVEYPTNSSSELLYLYTTNENPICPKGKMRKFDSFTKGYRKGCGYGKECECNQQSRSNWTSKFNEEQGQQIKEACRKSFHNRLLTECTKKDIIFLSSYEDYEKYGHNSGYYFNWQCKKCDHTFMHNLDDSRFPICRVCNPKKSNSAEQDEVIEFIKTIYDGKILINDQEVLRINENMTFELDIVLPDLKIAIEYGGIYYHNETVKKEQYHIRKHHMAYGEGYTLLTIFSDEWKTKQELTKRMLAHKIGRNNDYIHARKTKVVEIPWNAMKLFLEENHIQGQGVSTGINLGLMYGDELISVMNFGSPNNEGNKKRYEYELKRYSTTKRVNGGASKLFSYFCKKFNPKSVLSYQDARWGSGNLYRKLGFNFIGETKPNYFWVNKNTERRYTRHTYTKQKLIDLGYDEGKSETEIMKELGFLKVFDCGNRKFEWTPL